ncbi:MAG TPA: SsrA-binding protein, partial [Ochrobactrum anthropi]|nr:SsrA-binding protein [Brucella anthropi]
MNKPKNSPVRKIIAENRKARFNFEILDTLEAGLVLTGTEVKTLRNGRATLSDAYATVEDNGEALLINANIPEYEFGTWRNHSAKRSRKLLLHRKEITRIQRALDSSGRTLIPLSLYFKDGYAKVQIGIATGKKDWDKRRDLAERDA